MLGIGVYLGLDVSFREYEMYIRQAAALGFRLIFSSLHIPEADAQRLGSETKKLIELCSELGLKLVIDTSAEYYDRYDWQSMPLHALRLDFGFSNEQIVDLSQSLSCKISLNASVVDAHQLEHLKELGLNVGNVEVCHNYYPRLDTGISRAKLQESNAYFKALGFSTMAFVASHHRPRAPLYEGLPTLEEHRYISPVIAAQHLQYLQTDHVVIGDAMASLAELQLFEGLHPNCLRLLIKHQPDLSDVAKDLLQRTHTNRQDMGNNVIRSQESRAMAKQGATILAQHTITRNAYSVCLDNVGYLRYAGELQIGRYVRASDPRVNVIADASLSAVLIDSMSGGEYFEFVAIV
jgi:uncharacterized protein